MTESEQKEFLINTMVALLKQLKAYQLFVDWVKDMTGGRVGEIQKVLDDFRSEIAKEPDLENRFRGIVEDALQSGDKNLDLAQTLALLQWTPKGRPN